MKKVAILLLLSGGAMIAKAQTTTDTVTHITTIKNSQAGTVTTINPATGTSRTVNSTNGVTTTVNLLTGVTTTVTAPIDGNSLRKYKIGDDSEWKAYPIGATSEYKATVLNANFTVPLLRFNRTTGDDTKKGSVSLFNSVGAGIGISMGRLVVTTDNAGNTINTEMTNTFGIQLGVLFAANATGGSNQENIFAPTLSMAILNFHVGYGYELGTIQSTSQKRGFLTIAYGIPLSKLIKGGFYILRRTPDPVHTTNKAAETKTEVAPAGVSRDL